MEKNQTGIELIAIERKRQIEVEGWRDNHDHGHMSGEMAGAGAAYVVAYLNKKSGNTERFRFERYINPEKNFFVNNGDRGDRQLHPGGWEDGWPWDEEYDKRFKHDPMRCLVIAGALIAAEIDRLKELETGALTPATPQ